MITKQLCSSLQLMRNTYKSSRVYLYVNPAVLTPIQRNNIIGVSVRITITITITIALPFVSVIHPEGSLLPRVCDYLIQKIETNTANFKSTVFFSFEI